MLNGVGFFHFGSPDKSTPLRSLVQELEKKAAQGGELLKGALIVLPEAFNLGVDYNDDGNWGKGNYAPSIKKCLMRVAEEFDVMFVPA